ncbi:MULTISPECIES: ABC transporter ATP-binding protein [Roseobacteraceae]|uniref:Spermidine/putrescine import ATP-binding protein PotA n=1 Tax=Celeribacter baekdonensis B30 TaxID=1208323 RepID=K2JMY5_9RHOB|nr:MULTISPECIES: ABC transporter ATP-binding protein [Roseobacteraceae]EKE71859.1 spermidine/putrescine ABC transporter ATPase [Celeribacter baekdonensis B30]KAB6715290.1 polyamine ABC transporter ATP-binding protein [Roseobacter sp. TSBP12]|tara:strand:- start:20243 stop:21304 length:1062 start_codon:yes stop_codon:yes gene_type:complete
MTQSFLSIKDVSKTFGTVQAVDGLSLDIRKNEFFALLGASGSGKTTLLRMLAGFEDLSAGDITLEGTSIAGLAPNQRPLNLMFQSYALFPHMTVAQNIAYGLEMDRLPKAEIAARVNEILEVIQLGHLAKRKPEQLSGGQRQRVALARALVKRPKVLLLDEPLGALDKKLRSEMQLELKRLQHEFGITFIIVTHDQEEALVMADRIAIMKDGKLLQVGTPHDIYEAPQSKFAADFIGVMNFLPVEKKGTNFVGADGSVIRSESVTEIAKNGAAIAAIRPERLHVTGTGENQLSGEIAAVAYHGLDLLLHIKTPLSDTPVISRMTADEADGHAPEVGQSITVQWSAKDTHIFPN